MNFEYDRFLNCNSSYELAHIYKKTLSIVKMNMTEPNSSRSEIVDCEIIETGGNSQQWWLFPFKSTILERINGYNEVEKKKEGMYTLLFWKNLLCKQTLHIKNSANEEKLIREMVDTRDEKCVKIAQKTHPANQKEYEGYFVECLRRT